MLKYRIAIEVAALLEQLTRRRDPVGPKERLFRNIKASGVRLLRLSAIGSSNNWSERWCFVDLVPVGVKHTSSPRATMHAFVN